MNEGEEPEEFWEALGGKKDFVSLKSFGIPVDFEPRLFNVSNAAGYMYVKEVFGFMQEDLVNEDVQFLDCYSTVFIWIGNLSNDHERKQAYVRAEKYIEGIQDGRNTDDVQLIEVEAGKEPPSFTVQFMNWEDELAEAWLNADPLKILHDKEVEKKEAEEAKVAHAEANPYEGF